MYSNIQLYHTNHENNSELNRLKFNKIKYKNLAEKIYVHPQN